MVSDSPHVPDLMIMLCNWTDWMRKLCRRAYQKKEKIGRNHLGRMRLWWVMTRHCSIRIWCPFL
jgi:hypothetical protein